METPSRLDKIMEIMIFCVYCELCSNIYIKENNRFYWSYGVVLALKQKYMTSSCIVVQMMRTWQNKKTHAGYQYFEV